MGQTGFKDGQGFHKTVFKTIVERTHKKGHARVQILFLRCDFRMECKFSARLDGCAKRTGIAELNAALRAKTRDDAQFLPADMKTYKGSPIV